MLKQRVPCSPVRAKADRDLADIGSGAPTGQPSFWEKIQPIQSYAIAYLTASVVLASIVASDTSSFQNWGCFVTGVVVCGYDFFYRYKMLDDSDSS